MRRWIVAMVLALGAAACQGTASPTGGGGSSGSGTGGVSGGGGVSGSGGAIGSGGVMATTGLCQDTCTRDCAQDQDCNLSGGEMCCDLGATGKTCLMAAMCPRQCTLDSQCSAATGQLCVRETLAIPQKFCDDAAYGLTLCQSDASCNSGDICCKNYREPICVPPSQCPKPCTASTDCQTAAGEICCTTVRALEPTLGVTGLCLNPTYAACPKHCQQSTECNTAGGEICCNGLCGTSCAKTCQQNSDCNAQICCKSALTRLPDMETHVFSTGPSCKGTPYYTCSSSSCSMLPGCVPTSSGYCAQSSSYACSYWGGFSSYQTYCTGMGCSFDPVTYACTGTPTPCASYSTSTSCNGNDNCAWYSSSTICTGTPTPCTQLTSSTQCASQYGCTWSL